MKGKLYFDGSCEPTNPGKAVAGALLQLETGQEYNYTQLLGQGSNNTAEYGGLILGLTQARKLGVTHIQIIGDSQLVVKCVRGEWRSKQAHLTLLIQHTRHILSTFDDWTLEWIPRELNLADRYSRTNKMSSYGTILDLSLTPSLC